MNCLQRRINELYPKENIKVIHYTTMKEPATVKCNLCGTEYSLKKGENFVRKNKKCVCKKCFNNGSGGRMDLPQIEAKLKKKYPLEDITVLSWGLTNDPIELQCNTCGYTQRFETRGQLFDKNKHRFCHNCFKNKRDALKKTVDDFMSFAKTSEQWEWFPFPKEIRSNTLILAKCKKCGRVTKKSMYDYKKGRGCMTCQGNERKTLEQYQAEIGEEYTVLKYNGMDHPALFKHNLCNFIYKGSCRKGYGCPKCRGTKGEKTIRYLLDKANIEYEEQKIYLIEGHKLRVDFYLPSIDKVIEYNGIQHYEPIGFFGGRPQFEKQQEYDEMKRKYFGDKLIEIKYTENIKEALTVHKIL